MKKSVFVIAMMATAVVFYNCHGSKKATATKTARKLNYESDLKAVIEANCSPCHIPAKGGNKRPYDNFANVAKDIDEMIRRIDMNPTDRGFMPFRKPTKLPDSTINVFKKWKADGLLEK
jgi:uncharacterized membrane protein